jgi:HD-like signal output (HDOD) protein
MRFEATSLVDGIETLKSLPAAYLNIRKVIENPVSSTNDLARAISADPGLTARLLKLVNSPLYGFSSKIETVSRALVILGMQQVHDLALATTVAVLYKSAKPKRLSMGRYWRESVYCALTARCVAKLCNVLDSERLFVAGLLHAVGHLVMDERIPDETDAARRQAQSDKRPLAQVEKETIGCNYAEVGALLAKRWSMPPALISAIEYQVDPTQAPSPAFNESILHIAYWLMRGVIDQEPNWSAHIAPESWTTTGLTPDCFSAVKVQADAQLADTLSMLSNGSAAA